MFPTVDLSYDYSHGIIQFGSLLYLLLEAQSVSETLTAWIDAVRTKLPKLRRSMYLRLYFFFLCIACVTLAIFLVILLMGEHQVWGLKATQFAAVLVLFIMGLFFLVQDAVFWFLNSITWYPRIFLYTLNFMFHSVAATILSKGYFASLSYVSLSVAIGFQAKYLDRNDTLHTIKSTGGCLVHAAFDMLFAMLLDLEERNMRRFWSSVFFAVGSMLCLWLYIVDQPKRAALPQHDAIRRHFRRMEHLGRGRSRRRRSSPVRTRFFYSMLPSKPI